LWSADPRLIGDIDRTERIITGTAHHVEAPGLCGAVEGAANNVYGFGWVDTLAAAREALGQ
jgi:hypothetical protein